MARSKSKRYRVAYIDVPGSARYMPVYAMAYWDVPQALLSLVYGGEPGNDAYIALAIVQGLVKEDQMREPHAYALLRLLEIVDGQRTDNLAHWEMAGAAWLCRLPLKQRALWYYIACDRLGYDPAEGCVQPERI